MVKLVGSNAITINAATMMRIVQHWIETECGEAFGGAKITNILWSDNSFLLTLDTEDKKP